MESGYDVLFDPSHPDVQPPDAREHIFQQIAVASPEKRLELERNFVYDVLPVDDNKPYFYKIHKDVVDINAPHIQDFSHNDLIVFAALGVLVLIFLPLKRIKGDSAKRIFRRYGLFFCLSGFAFLLFETSLIQVLGIFVGGPVYSLAVTLVSVLAGYGLGSYLSSRFNKTSRYFLIISVLSSSLIVIAFALLPGLIKSLMPLDNQLRVLTAIAVALFLSIPLGMLVPAGADLVREDDQNAVAWMWGINSGFNVLGGISYLALSQTIGIRETFLVVAALYLTAGITMALTCKRRAAGNV